jgi:hypothetical protein
MILDRGSGMLTRRNIKVRTPTESALPLWTLAKSVIFWLG